MLSGFTRDMYCFDVGFYTRITITIFYSFGDLSHGLGDLQNSKAIRYVRTVRKCTAMLLKVAVDRGVHNCILDTRGFPNGEPTF